MTPVPAARRPRRGNAWTAALHFLGPFVRLQRWAGTRRSNAACERAYAGGPSQPSMQPRRVLLPAALLGLLGSAAGPLRPAADGASAPSLVAQAGGTQTPPSPDAVGPRPVAVPDPEGEALVNDFGSKLKAWNDRKMLLSRGGKTPDPRELGPHPALEYKARFQALLEQDSGWAQVWWIDNLEYVTPAGDAALRKRTLVETYDKLLARNASQPYMMYVLGNVRAQRDLLGDETVDDMLARLVAASTNVEVQARAAQMRAAFHAPRDPAADPRRWEEALEMHRGVVATWPKSVAAQESANALLPDVERAFERAQRAWLARCLELQKQGGSPKDWPPQPIHATQPEMRPLAQTGQPGATRWINRFYNAYVSHEAQGIGPALVQLAIGLGPSYPVSNAEVGDLRLGLCELLLRQFPAEPFLQPLLDDLLQSFDLVDPVLAERALAPLLESAEARRKGLGFHLMTRAHLGRLDWPSALKALAWCERMTRECPDDPLLARTQKLCAHIAELQPGRPAPDFEVQDLEKKRFRLSDYAGRVVLLAFYNLFLDQGFADVPAWRDFQSRNALRPFTMLGVNSGPADAESFYSKAAKLGISWRTGMLYRNADDVLQAWHVKSYPTVVVIDADGVIRGRDLPWEETRALLQELIGKAEARKPR